MRIGKLDYNPVGRHVMLLAMAAVLMIIAGCNEPGADEGIIITEIILPTDTLLNLACADVGINTETCVLTDPENPFRFVATPEFDVNNPDAETKFDVAEGIREGPTGAKARFYLWATALARRNSGENQWYTARALHELYTANQDELIRLQALKAYRSNLDNFFGALVYFNEFGFDFPASLNELVACDIYRPPTGFAEIALDENGNPEPDLGKQELFGSWGFIFIPGPDDNDPCANSVVSAGT